MSQYLQDSLLYNCQDIAAEAYISGVKDKFSAVPDAAFRVDFVIRNDATERLAARVVLQGTLATTYKSIQPSGQQFRMAEHFFCWFKSGRIAEIRTVEHLDSIREARRLGESPPAGVHDIIIPSILVEESYRHYIDCINHHRMSSELGQYCHTTVVHNERRLSLGEYRLLIEESQVAIQDLTFRIHTLIVDEPRQMLAVLLSFTGTPVKVWSGAKPNGNGVEFSELVFYWLDQGKIRRVDSLVDIESYRRQLAG